jgi:hypothetical protein
MVIESQLCQMQNLAISNIGRVGIKGTTPAYDLSVNGTLGVTGATTLSAPLTVNSSAVFNEGSADCRLPRGKRRQRKYGFRGCVDK